jgi:hypothetical protein
MSPQSSKAMRSGALAPMSGEGTSRVERTNTLAKAITFVFLAAFGTWAIYSGLAMATGDPQAHIGVGVFCLLGAVLLYWTWLRPVIIGS